MLQWSVLTPASLRCVAAIGGACCGGTLAHLGVLTVVTDFWVPSRCCSGVFLLPHRLAVLPPSAVLAVAAHLLNAASSLP
jgi:hypothetical protein